MANKKDLSFNAKSPKYSALVEYRQPSYALVRKAFNWVYDGYEYAKFVAIEACKNVPRKTREIAFELVHLNKRTNTDKALAELDRRGLRPALYEELLAFVAKYPRLQKRFPIVALGSVCMYAADLCSPCVGWLDHGRHLSLLWIDDGWRADFRFLAVRK